MFLDKRGVASSATKKRRILKNGNAGETELKMLEAVKGLDPVENNLVVFNVMLVNHERESPTGAPEVSLGLPFSEAIDMWRLGCLLLSLYINNHPYSSCEYQPTPLEYHITTGIEPKKGQGVFKTLQDLITLYPVTQGFLELTDRRAFISLIHGLLEMDPDERLTPKIALSHPFLTMVHLMEDKDSPYFADAQFIMQQLGLDNDDQES
ncbi:unnamed protein product [Pleuronectes platessa]|uniref:Protein kinase domain-containing protein n=1 Tax=Pleuronectes platessa TaxID=8262 RepID=A0A9N7TU59_PLEPL|nr:unnamed protein product [Pleuronectes platessa]